MAPCSILSYSNCDNFLSHTDFNDVLLLCLKYLFITLFVGPQFQMWQWGDKVITMCNTDITWMLLILPRTFIYWSILNDRKMHVLFFSFLSSTELTHAEFYIYRVNSFYIFSKNLNFNISILQNNISIFIMSINLHSVTINLSLFD